MEENNVTRMSEEKWKKLQKKYGKLSHQEIYKKKSEQAIVPVLLFSIPWLCFANGALPVQIVFFICAVWMTVRNVNIACYEEEYYRRIYDEMLVKKIRN